MKDAEQVLWKELRKYSLGWRFRRQFPIPPYIVDFACVAARLVVEADGGQHALPVITTRATMSCSDEVGGFSGSGTMKSLPTVREC
jgi:hypothetical protein